MIKRLSNMLDAYYELKEAEGKAAWMMHAPPSPPSRQEPGEHPNTDATYEQAMANARLIAAAPDMLEALKEVKRLFEYRGDDATAFAAKVEAEIVAAIAKAEGQP